MCTEGEAFAAETNTTKHNNNDQFVQTDFAGRLAVFRDLSFTPPKKKR